MKHQFDGGNAIVEAFHKLGVEYILSSPGTEWAPVWEAMAAQIHRKKDGPKLLDVWHETLAVVMAAGCAARSTHAVV
jgi:thiamine pyrophosphate-dependent acetolactate synthase large subunit-like protein